MDDKRIAVVGGGPAGMMSAIQASLYGAKVTLYEKNHNVGVKLSITGKGRCNVTNNCDLETLLQNIPTNPKFLYSAFHNFGVEDVMNFFEECNVPLKTERGNRVFPVSDKAKDIVSALYKKCLNLGVEIVNKKVNNLAYNENICVGVITDNGIENYDAVILATGGKSYPKTGSTGDGYSFLKGTGHTISPLSPSLIPILCKGNLCASMQGLSLKNVALKVLDAETKKVVYTDFGEMMFTHFGVTGPMILSASAHLTDIKTKKYICEIDLKPALSHEMLETRLLSDFSKYINKDFINSLSDLLPQKMIEPFVKLTGIDARKKINSITKEEREKMISILKAFPIEMVGFRPLDEAIVTRGGVNVNEVSSKTMESKLIKNLYFAGEILDVDAYTGGFNLQIAFSTGALAGKCSAIN